MIFGHLGDGNVHVNVLGPDARRPRGRRGGPARWPPTAGARSAPSTASGVAKARCLGLVRSPGELAAMAAIKRALDPDGLLNPGAVLP